MTKTKDELVQLIISDKAEELLRTAQESGWIVYFRASNGTTIGHKTLRSAREIAEWDEAIDDLVDFRFLEKKNENSYQIEAIAYRWLDAHPKK
jgi:cytosine/adenosine deaminase-related metal-dependent hydrolase